MFKVIFRSSCVALLLAAISILPSIPVQAEEMTCPEHTPVVIDIKPGSYPNAVNLSSQGLLPVALISTPGVDASQFTPEMAHLSDASMSMDAGCSGAMAVRWVRDDVNHDGKTDIVFFFRVQDLNFSSTTTAASLMAHGSYGGVILHILGADSVKVVLK